MSGPDRRKARAQRGDNIARVVDAERGLGDEGRALGIARLDSGNILDRADQMHAALIRPMVPSTSGWPAWPISATSKPFAVSLTFFVNLGDQRAGRVDHAQSALARRWLRSRRRRAR